MITTDDKLLTSEDLADALSISVRTVHRLVSSGLLPCYRLSKRSLRFKFDEVTLALSRVRVPARSESRPAHPVSNLGAHDA